MDFRSRRLTARLPNRMEGPVTLVGQTTGIDDPTSARSLVGRVFETLELLAEMPRAPAELAQSLGVDRSSALRLLRQLAATGYVARDDLTMRYGPVGTKFLGLVSHAPDHADLSELVDPILRVARADYGEATLLAVPARGSMVYAAFFPSPQTLGIRERLGAIRPMHCSAVGKAYLSGLPDDALEQELAHMSYSGGTMNAATDRATLYEDVVRARRNGYAMDRDETSLGVSCVAVPLRIGGGTVGAIGLTGPSSRLSEPVLCRIGQDLAAMSSSLGSLFGRAR